MLMDQEGQEPGLPAPDRLSDMLADLAADTARERVSAADLLDSFGDRAMGVLLFIFALPNVMPIGLPGTSMVLGVPLTFLTAQMVLGARRPWLPGWIRARSLRQEDFAAVIRRILPLLHRVERVVRPRLAALTTVPAERMIGLLGLVLSVTIALPIPFGNALPACTIAVLAFGLIERDGAIVALGGLLSVVSFAITAGVLAGIFYAWLWLTESAA